MQDAPMTLGPDPKCRAASLRQIAATSPSARLTGSDTVYVFRYHDVQMLLHDSRLGGIGLRAFDQLGIESSPLRDWYSSLMRTSEGLTHHGLRHLVAKAFSPVSAERLRQHTAKTVIHAVRPLICDGGGDLVTATRDIPMRAMCQLLGIPSSLVPEFVRWIDDVGAVFGCMTTEQTAAAAAALDPLLSCIGDIVAERAAHPSDDVISALLAAELDGRMLTRSETVAMTLDLLVGGHDTTASQIACSLFALLQRADVMRLALSDPDVLASIVTETIRLEPSMDGVLRSVVSSVDVCGDLLAPGSLVMLCTLTANRDGSVWQAPDEFIPDRTVRTPSPRLLTFGAGAHYCLGAALATMTLTETIREVVTHMPVLLADPDKIQWTSSLGRRPVCLPVAI
jgi:cytochrome P450